MEFNFEKNIVNVFSKTYKLDYIINKLASLSGEQLRSFFAHRNLLIARRLNCLALYSVINKKLRFLNSNSFNRDFFERIQHYQNFTELQLFNLYKDVATYDDFYEYRKNLIKILLHNYAALNFKDGEIQYLLNLKKLPMESFEEYFDSISYSCYEQENTFDGQDIEVLKETLEFSASTSDIYELAEKYGIKLPLRLKKDDFLGYIYWWFEKNNAINVPIEEEINNMTINQLTEFASGYNMGMSVSLSKGELVRYFFYVLSKYQIPRTTVKRLEIPEEFNPISFEVKMENTSQFKTDKPKKVLYFEGDSLDKDTLAFENELSDIYNDVKDDEKNFLVDQEVKTYELPKKEIKVVVVNEVTKEDLNVLKYSKVKGVDLKTAKALLKTDIVEEETIEEVVEADVLESNEHLTVEETVEVTPEPVSEVVEEEVLVEETVQEPEMETTNEENNVDEILVEDTTKPELEVVEDTATESNVSEEDYEYDDYEDEINGVKPSSSKNKKKSGKLLKAIVTIVVLALALVLVVYLTKK
jgi:hypothetical protein